MINRSAIVFYCPQINNLPINRIKIHIRGRYPPAGGRFEGLMKIKSLFNAACGKRICDRQDVGSTAMPWMAKSGTILVHSPNRSQIPCSFPVNLVFNDLIGVSLAAEIGKYP